MVAAQLLPTVKLQVRAHMTTTANEPQPCGTDSASTCDLVRLCRSEACGNPGGPVLARRFQHETGSRFACSVLGAGPQMAVGVQRRGRSGMAQGALDGDDIASGGDQS